MIRGEMMPPPPGAAPFQPFGASAPGGWPGATATTSCTHSSMSSQGHRVEEVVVPYTPAETDYTKMKPLQGGGGAGYDFSSPFAFSQGDPSVRPTNPAVVEVTLVGASMTPMPDPAQMMSHTTQAQSSMESNHLMTQAPQWRPPAQQWQPPSGPQWQPGPRPPPPQYMPPPLEGWLNKKSEGGVSSAWNMRWWFLNGNVMCYSRDERGEEGGRIVLTSHTEVRPLSHPQATTDARVLAPRYKFGFEIYQGPGQRTWYLDAGSLEKRNLWLDRLQQAVGALRQAAWSHGPPASYGGPPGGYR